jgi:gluconolactonase
MFQVSKHAFRIVSRLPAAMQGSAASTWREQALGGRGSGSFLEGPCFTADGAFRCVDIPFGRVLELSGSGEWRERYAYDGWPNGMKMLPDGRALVADHRLGIVEIASDFSSHRILAAGAPGESFHGTNDLCLAPGGGVYFTDQGVSGLDAPYGRVFHRSPDGVLSKLMDGIPSPNGIAPAADGGSLLVAVTRANAIWRLPLTVSGEVRKAGLFIQLSGGIGPDGLAVTPDGHIVVAHAGLGVWLFAPNGMPLKLWHSPGLEYVTNLAAQPGQDGAYYVTESATASVLQIRLDD